MIALDLNKTCYVIGQIGHGNCGIRPDNAYSSEYESTHRALNKSEYVFNSTANL